MVGNVIAQPFVADVLTTSNANRYYLVYLVITSAWVQDRIARIVPWVGLCYSPAVMQQDCLARMLMTPYDVYCACNI